MFPCVDSQNLKATLMPTLNLRGNKVNSCSSNGTKSMYDVILWQAYFLLISWLWRDPCIPEGRCSFVLCNRAHLTADPLDTHTNTELPELQGGTLTRIKGALYPTTHGADNQHQRTPHTEHTVQLLAALSK